LNRKNVNPFLEIENPKAWGQASIEMSLPLVKAVNIKPGMRILEVGGGSGQIATTIARH
jgi:ubiquinone/menaquinone biosynthesis C-methylase UbiE